MELDALLSDHGIVPRNVPFPVRGWNGVAGEEVMATLAGRFATTRVGPDGTWRVVLPAIPVGGPYDLTVNSAGKSIVVRDLLAGDLWLCSGQSNMGWPLGRLHEADREAAEAGDDLLRYFAVREAVSAEALQRVDGLWRRAVGDEARTCPAVAYHFARRLRKTVDVPIGIVASSMGDTDIAAWMPRAALEARDDHRPLVAAIPPRTPDRARPDLHVDTGNEGEGWGWASPDFDDAAWSEMDLPGYWQSRGLLCNGAVWFRRRAAVPEAWRGRGLTVEWGAVDDHDVTYLDGIRIGATGSETPEAYSQPRRYSIPAGQVEGGEVQFAIRVFDIAGTGGITGRRDQMRIYPSDAPGEAVVLAGRWKYRVERPCPLLRSMSPAPTLLYNAMIHPLSSLPITGAIWYQGETDRFRAAAYGGLFEEMVRAWRKAWRSEFPFYFVQLANYMPRQDAPTESVWAELREAQRLASKAIPRLGMAVAIDVGEAGNIHPDDKRSVGERLGTLALRDSYGIDVPASGPRLREWRWEGGSLRLFFDDAAGLALTDNGAAFAVSGADRRFRWASVRVDGETVVVSHPEIPRPDAVRYGWQDNPPCALRNAAGLPASPFRTDAWPLTTDGILL